LKQQHQPEVLVCLSQTLRASPLTQPTLSWW